MEKKDLDQFESDSSKPTKSEEMTENEGQGKSASSSSQATIQFDLQAVGHVQKVADKLEGRENQDSSLKKKKMKLQENEQVEDAMETSEDENSFNWTFENMEVAQKVFSIELILIKIFENLPAKSLVNFRLVNKTWEKEATNIIMKGSKTVLRFRKGPKVVNNHNFSELNECIRKSRRFPCSYFDLKQVVLDVKGLNKFFTLHGSEVKRLELSFYSKLKGNEGGVSKFEHVLLNQVPNIEVFRIRIRTFYGTFENPTKTRLFPENSVLAHLKSFTYCDFFFASEIIRVSPNLKQVFIEDSSLNGIEALKSMNKVPALKQVCITKDYKNLGLLELLADETPKPLGIVLKPCHNFQRQSELLDNRFANALSKILRSSKETMVHMELCLHLDFFKGVKWPRLKNVRGLVIQSGDRDRIDIQPNFIAFVFPNIWKLQNFGTHVPSLFNSDTPLAHLKECVLHQDKILNLDNLASFAPNLTKLQVRYIQDLHGIANSLWACSGLKYLELEFFAATNSFPHVDMAFTGLEEEMVRKLHEDPDFFNEMKKKKKVSRPNSSILNCPDLTFLKILFNIKGANDQQPDSLITAVTTEFGFKMLDKLIVEISTRHSTMDCIDSRFENSN